MTHVISHPASTEEPAPVTRREIAKRQDLGGSREEILGAEGQQCSFTESDAATSVAMEIVRGKRETQSGVIELLRPVMVEMDFVAIRARISSIIRNRHLAVVNAVRNCQEIPEECRHSTQELDLLYLAEEVTIQVVKERMESLNSSSL